MKRKQKKPKFHKLFKALSCQTRFNILMEIAKAYPDEITCSEVYTKLKIEQSKTSHSLSILKSMGIISHRRDQYNSYYRINNYAFINSIIRLNHFYESKLKK